MTRPARGAFFFSTEGVLGILTDNVNHPAHYEAGPFECVELTRLYPFMGGNAIKYVYRHRLKGRDAEDLRKALWYLDHAKPDELRLGVRSDAWDGFSDGMFATDRDGVTLVVQNLRAWTVDILG